MTKEYGVTHFTELHRILHKYFLIWRCQNDTSFFGAEGETRPLKAKAFFGTHAGTATVRWTVAILRIAFFESLFFTSKKEASKMMLLFWRRRRDSNSRAGYPTYALSRGASSPT